jgi:hypothetical protein
MTLRTLLLGSAAALLTVGGAQAADLGAEPVNYVKVCDAFGAGFYYAPGTDTCVKLGGFNRLDVNIKGSEAGPAGNYPNATHTFGMYNILSVVAGTMTEYGPMMGVLVIENIIGGPIGSGGVGSGPGLGFGNVLGVDTATLSLGPLSAGFGWSAFSNNIFATYHNAQFSPLGGNHTQFVQLSYAVSGVGLFIAAEDYRTRDFGGAGTSTGQIPDIVGGISFAAGGINAKITAGWGDRTVTDTYGIHGDIGIGLGALGNLNVQATYSANADDWACWRVLPTCGATGNFTGVYAGLTSSWSAQFSTLIAGLWFDGPAAADGYTRIIGQANFNPVRNFLIGAEVSHMMPEGGGPSSTTGIVRFQRAWP